MARILIIDDDADVRMVTQDILESAGHEVDCAANGLEGLGAQRRSPCDVAVVDLFMPEKEGVETIQDLKREFPRLKIVAMSGGGRSIHSARYLETASKLGAGAVLTKPFDAPTLLSAIDRLLHGPGSG